MVDEDSANLEEYDFDFLEVKMKGCSEELTGAIQSCIETLQEATTEAQALEGSEDLSATIQSQISTVSAIRESFQEFLKHTSYVKGVAKHGKEQLDKLHHTVENSEGERESLRHKVGYLEDELRRNKDQLQTYERSTGQLEQDIEALRQEMAAKDEEINEHKEEYAQLEQDVEKEKREKMGHETATERTHAQLSSRLTEQVSELEELKERNAQLTERCLEREKKISEHELHQLDLEEKFKEWENVFKTEMDKARSKVVEAREDSEKQSQTYLDQIKQLEGQIQDLNLKLSAADAESALQHDMISAQDEFDETIDEGEDADGDENKLALSGEFNRQSDSQLEGDEENSGAPMSGDDLMALQGEGSMMGMHREAEYAEIDGAHSGDIFGEDSLNENDKIAMLNTVMSTHDDAMSSASTISQKWENDARKDPEEEYFRLSCLALKIIYNEQDTDFVFTVSPGKLYSKCKKMKIPFHLWYTWIENELQKVNEQQKRAVEAAQRPRSLMERLMGAISSTGNRATPRQR